MGMSSVQKLGPSDLEVSPLSLGGNVFGWTADEAQSFAVLDAYTAALPREVAAGVRRAGAGAEVFAPAGRAEGAR